MDCSFKAFHWSYQACYLALADHLFLLLYLPPCYHRFSLLFIVKSIQAESQHLKKGNDRRSAEIDGLGVGEMLHIQHMRINDASTQHNESVG